MTEKKIQRLGTVNNCSYRSCLQNRPTVFSTFGMDKLRKIRRHHWKERLKISKIAKFQSDLLKTNEDIAPQSREILQRFVCRGHWQTPTHPPPPPYKRLYTFSQFFGAISSLA